MQLNWLCPVRDVEGHLLFETVQDYGFVTLKANSQRAEVKYFYADGSVPFTVTITNDNTPTNFTDLDFADARASAFLH